MSGSNIRHLRYESLRKQLNEEKNWPLRYKHKVIGHNSDRFRQSANQLLRRNPKLRVLQEKVSRQGAYLSLTYELVADNADEIISLWVDSEKVEDVVKVI